MRKLPLLFFCFLVVGLVNLDKTDAQGFFNPLEELDFWSEEELPLPVYFWDNGNSGLDSATGLSLDSNGALQAAINTWNDASTNSLGFSFMGTSTTYQENAVNVSYGHHEAFDVFDAIGIALIDYNVDFDNPHLPQCEWKATGADVLINEGASFTTHAGNSASFDLQSLFTHELGHVLGLPHVDNQLAVMNSNYNGLRELQAVDLAMLAEEKVFETVFCPLPLSSAGEMSWSLSANSGAGVSNIEDALVLSVLSGDIPQTSIPGFVDPEPTAEVSVDSEANSGLDELVISFQDGYLADGSQEIEFGVTIEDLFWTDGAQRQLLGVDENGQVELEVQFLRRVSSSPIDFSDVTDSVTLMANVTFDGSRLEIEPVNFEFNEALFFDFTNFSSNGLRGIEIRGISFGIQSVPEPNAASLFVLLGAVLCRRRQRLSV